MAAISSLTAFFRSKFGTGLLITASVGCVALASTPARADIMFVDLNFSYQEVGAARAEASKRKEKLLVIPNISDAERHNLRGRFDEVESIRKKGLEITKQRLQAEASYKKKKSAKLKKKIADLQKLEVKIQTLLAQKVAVYDSMRFRGGDIDVTLHNGIKQTLIDADLRGAVITSVIVSGHNDGGNFFGEAGGIKDAELFSMLTTHKSSMNTGSFYGWGCYTVTRENARMAKESVPSLKVIAGFDNRSPSQNFSGDLQYLQYVMRREAQAKAIKSAKEAQRFVKAIPHQGSMTPALLLDTSIGLLYVTAHGVTKFADLDKDCTPDILHKALTLSKSYEKFRDSSAAGFEDVPQDEQNGSLRKFYTLLRQYSHCAAFQSLKLAGTDANLVIPLVLFREVRTNFGEYYVSEWQNLRNIMAKVPGGMDPPDLLSKNTRRADILKLNQSMSAAYQAETRNQYLNQDEIAFLGKMLGRVEKIMIDFSCTPTKWIEPSIGLPVAPDIRCVE